MKNDEAYARAYDAAPRNADGSLIHDALVHLVAQNIAFDADEARIGKARRIVANRMKPGQTAPEGAVVFDGMEPYLYEPHRLLADDAGNVTENKDARVRFKDAEAARAKAGADRALVRLTREQQEAAHFRAWTSAELAKGRDPSEVTWDTCVRETGLWKDAEPDDGEPGGAEINEIA